MTGAIYVGVDVGGSGMRVQARIDGVPASGRDESEFGWADGEIDMVALVDRITRVVQDTLGTPRPIRRIGVGTTGMPGLIERPEDLAMAVGRRLDAQTVIVASDALSTHIGALAGAVGTVVAAGTGVIALGTDHAQIWNQADGWGYLLGDRGGGAWIGGQGISAALDAYDHRLRGSSALLDRAVSTFGSPDRLLGLVYRSGSAPRALARFAPEVAAAARAGDRVAAGIWENAGRYLASAAHAAGRNLPPLVSWGGRLFAAGDLLTAPFRDELETLRPGTQAIAPHGQSADGALTLATSGIECRAESSRFVRCVDISSQASPIQDHIGTSTENSNGL